MCQLAPSKTYQLVPTISHCEKAVKTAESVIHYRTEAF